MCESQRCSSFDVGESCCCNRGAKQTIDIDFEINGEPILPTYSRTIQLAFDRVGELDRYTETELSQTNEWLVISQIPLEKQFFTSAKPTTIESLSLLRGAYIWHLENPLETIEKLEESKEIGHIEAFYPLVERQQIPRSTPNDPEFSSQWHLENTGQTNGLVGEDINATNVWNNYRGDGVVIRIVDDGLTLTPDIIDNYNSTYSTIGVMVTVTQRPTRGMGIIQPGVAAAVGNNSLNVAGAAWEATLAGSTLIACGSPDSMEADALSFRNDKIDIYSNSWGPSDDGTTLAGPGPLTLAAFEEDAYQGRKGLGNTITWAAGNGLGSDDDATKTDMPTADLP